MKLNKQKKNNTKSPESLERLREIINIVAKYDIIRGVTPDKLVHMMEEMGPTYIKLGQIISMRTDILPKEYCAELVKLRTAVSPMPVEDAYKVIEESCGRTVNEIFDKFEKIPLGSASIAQVHKAKLKNGRDVVVKVQRIDIYKKMARDIVLLKRASRIIKIMSGAGNTIDFPSVLDELWVTMQQETDFLNEANNIRLFWGNNKKYNYINCPEVIDNLTTPRVLVMTYVAGIDIDNIDLLDKSGYDRHEIGYKLCENYIAQVVDDGFFHADPHPGNIKIDKGKIVWLDMGMMGKISDKDKIVFSEAIRAVAKNDISGVKDAVLTLGKHKGKEKINHSLLYQDIEDTLMKYGDIGMGSVDVVAVVEDLIKVAKTHEISMPSNLSMLARGLGTLQGLLSKISPDINFIDIMTTHIKTSFIKNINWNYELEHNSQVIFDSSKKALEIPGLIFDILKLSIKGQTKLNMDLNMTEDFKKTSNNIIENLVVGLLIAALLISSSLICTTDMQPKLLNLPLLGVLGYLVAVILALRLIYIFRQNNKK